MQASQAPLGSLQLMGSRGKRWSPTGAHSALVVRGGRSENLQSCQADSGVSTFRKELWKS